MRLFNGWFDTRWYAMLYGHRDQEDASEMVLPIIEKARLRPGDRVLDMGCGRGRHAEIFTREGMRVTGIDLSTASVEEARSRVPDAEFKVHDICEPFAISAFDAVVCLFTSLGLSDDRMEDQRAVDAAAVALRIGGIFVLDLLNGAVVSRTLVTEDTLEIEGVRFDIRRNLEGDDIVKRITVQDGAEKHEFEEHVHAWRSEEVEAMIDHAGLALEEVTEGPGPETFDPSASKRMVFWARKH